MRDGIFILEGLDNHYPGQYDNLSWNGFYCPRFPVEVCRKILMDLQIYEGEETFQFEILENEIRCWRDPMDETDTPEVYPIDAGGFCRLGAQAWTWELHTNRTEELRERRESVILELASDLADEAVHARCVDMGIPATLTEVNGDTRYTEQAQDLFNQYYDEWEARIRGTFSQDE